MTSYSEIASIFIRIAVNSILIGTPISLGIFLVLKLTRAASPRKRYLLTVAAFFAAAVLPLGLTIVPISEKPPPQTTVSAEIPKRTFPRDLRAAPIEPGLQGELETTSVDPLHSLVGLLSQPSLSIGLFTLWVAVACLLLGREAASHLLVVRARRHLTPASANVRERLCWPKGKPLFVDDEFGPCALGVFHSIVVIPARLLEELSPAAAQQIARHELDHLKWRDPSVHAATRIVCASLWFSVPLWYLHRATRLEREAASDHAVVNATASRLQTDIAAVEYAATLVSIARSCARIGGRRKHAWIATEIGHESGLNDRIQRLMAISSRLTGVRLSLAFVTLFACVSSLIILPIARLELKSYENFDERTPQKQSVVSSAPGFEMGLSKEGAIKPAKLATLRKVQVNTLDSKPANTRLTTVEDVVSNKQTATSTATDYAITVQPVPVVQPSLESGMAALGYQNLTPRQLADMRAYAVGPAYVVEMADSGYPGLSADMLIQFKWLAVSSFYIKEMKTLGYDNLSPQMLVEFRRLGVNSHYIRQMRSRISGSISAEQLVSLRLHGASTQFVDELKALGYTNLNAGQLIGMRLHGVSIAYIEDLQARGHKSLSANDLIGMRLRGSN